MFTCLRRTLQLFVLILPTISFAADATPADAGKTTRLQFVRSGSVMALVKARVEVNGRRIAELAKGESIEIMVEPGRTLVKVDSAFSSGQMVFSFSADKGAAYQFEVFDSVERMDADHLFGIPPKASGGEVLESTGMLKASLFKVNAPKPAVVEPQPVIQPIKTDAVPPPVPAPAKVDVAPPPVVQPAPVTPPAVNKPSVSVQLQELKKLFDQGLISNDVYVDKQKRILEGL